MPSMPATLLAMLGIGEVVPAEQVGRVAEQPRAHRVALAGDRVRAGAGPADVAGHQRQVDDRLRGADPLWLWLTPIVHQNETRLPSWIVSAKSLDLLDGQAGLRGDALRA